MNENKTITYIKNVKQIYGDKRAVDIFEKNILKRKNPQLSCFFARYVEGADIKAHEQVVLDSKNPMWNYMYVANNKEADILAHRNVVINSGDEYWIQQFEKLLNDNDVVNNDTNKQKRRSLSLN